MCSRGHQRESARWWLSVFAVLWLTLGASPPGSASGPRFVTGPPFFTAPQGLAIGWKQAGLLYYTDPANLSASVSHAQADALVAAAAGVWNIPQASITLTQGGQLAEHADASNVYLDVNGMVFPADVASSNFAAVPIAVLYDSDGSVTETLLGQGASDPSNCSQASVTESVDRFDPAGYILHAIVVLNGRCTGPAPEQQMELEYHLERAFGRVLGLAWSQANDNVFTGTPVPSYAQEQHWPILHPIDIVCGLYNYQCLAAPFQLRDDDISALVSVYPNARGATLAAGKQASLANAMQASGRIQFPNGQGMAGVNILVQRQLPNSQIRDQWIEGSNVSGLSFRRAGVSTFVAAGTDTVSSLGTTDVSQQGSYLISYIPVKPSTLTSQNLVITTEPVNPLYTGPYGLGPYTAGTVSPAGSGPAPPPSTNLYAYNSFNVNLPVPDAPQQCGTGSDGTLLAPMQEPASGWWTGQICGYGHAAYVGADVKPGRSFTLEVTALDQQGLATTQKLMPVLAFYAPADTTALPSLGLTAAAFQGLGLGTTTLSGTTDQLSRLRLGIADQRGEGRPDFSYQARLFYADAVVPAQLDPAGGTVTITGTGFRAANSVQINGVSASVTSWTANAIVVTLPAMAQVNASVSTPLDILVSDLGTGASSTMSGAFQYVSPGGLPNVMKLLSAQAGTAFAGQATMVPFSVQVLAPDGVTPIVGDPVTLSSAAGNVTFGACGGLTCVLNTDANGVISSTSTPTAVGSITLQAADAGLQQTANFAALAASGSIQVTSTIGSIPVGTPAQFTIKLLATNGSAMSARLVQFTVAGGSASFSGCFAAVCSVATDVHGIASVQVTPTAPGTVTLQAGDGSVSVQSSFQATDNSDIMLVSIAPQPTSILGQSNYFQIHLLKHDGVTPDAYQTIVFSGSSGAGITNCGVTQPCPLRADQNGYTAVLLNPTALGTYTVAATFGTVVQSGSFTVITQPPPQIHILSAPSGSVVVGTVAAQPFTVQLTKADGVTPLTGTRVTIAGAQDSVRLGICGAGSCLVNTDGRGMISTSVTPLLPGAITLNAVYQQIVQTATFTGLGPAASLQFIAQPGPGGVVVGSKNPITLQAIAIGGSSPGAGYISLSVAQGSAVVTPCGAPCGVKLDLNGLAKFTLQTIAPGPVTLTALWGAINQSLVFYSYANGDVMQLLSGPAGTLLTQVQDPVPFRVQVFASDGVTPAPGKAVTFSTSVGKVRFAACGAATCTLTTDAAGIASSSVTPIAEGVTTLTAYDGAANQADTLIAQDQPDLLRLVSAPASGSYAGSTAAAPFAVQVLLADGVTPAAGRSVFLSVTSGSALLGACGQAPACTVATDAAGLISSSVTALVAGEIDLLVNDRGVQMAAGFTAAVKPDQMLLIAAPTGNVTLGTAATPDFAVRVLDGYGNPITGRAVIFSASTGEATWSACPALACTVLTAADGSAAITVAPSTPGVITLNASSGPLTQAASLVGIAAPDTLALVSLPPEGSPSGVAAATSFAVRSLGGFPIHPLAGQNVTLTVTGGSALLTACGQSTCTVVTDPNGIALSGVEPLAEGAIRLQAQESSATVTASFGALAAPDLLRVLSSPSPQIRVGDVISLKVLVLAPDGLTPHPGADLQFTLDAGAATLAGSTGSVAVVATDAVGEATLSLTADALGSIAVSVVEPAMANSQRLSLLFNVVPLATGGYTILALDPVVYLAEQASLPLDLSVAVGQFGVPAPAATVTWSASQGFSLTSVDAASDASGTANALVTAGPLDAGASAGLSACLAGAVCAQFTATGVSDTLFRLALESGADQAVSGGAAYADVIVAVADPAAHPIAGAAVTVYQTVTAARSCPAQGRCPAAPVLATRVSVVRSGLDGRVTVTPLTVAGVACETHVALSADSSGFVTTVLSAAP